MKKLNVYFIKLGICMHTTEIFFFVTFGFFINELFSSLKKYLFHKAKLNANKTKLASIKPKEIVKFIIYTYK